MEWMTTEDKMLDAALFLASRLLEPLNPGKEGGKVLLGGSHVGRQLLLGGVQQGQVVPKLGCQLPLNSFKLEQVPAELRSLGVQGLQGLNSLHGVRQGVVQGLALLSHCKHGVQLGGRFAVQSWLLVLLQMQQLLLESSQAAFHVVEVVRVQETCLGRQHLNSLAQGLLVGLHAHHGEAFTGEANARLEDKQNEFRPDIIDGN